jgi:hypothetical protein
VGGDRIERWRVIVALQRSVHRAFPVS